MPDRQRTAHAAAHRLAAARPPAALVGFDGFIDSIIDVVDQRRDMTPEGYARLRTIPDFAARCAAAAGKSANLELVVKEDRFGGNGPLMAGALGCAGCPVTYVGAVGRPDEPTALHPLYRPFARLCREVVPVAPPASTAALEFDDGKLMLGQPANVQAVTWDVLLAALTPEGLIARLDAARILGMVNWTMMAGVEGIWRGLIDRVLPRLSATPAGEPARRVFIDLADPAKRTDADVAGALAILRRMDRLIPVTLGLNLAEAERLAAVTGAVPTGTSLGARTESLARGIRERTDLSCVVVHPREGAAGALREGDGVATAWFDGPFTARPRLSTGAGDHFNAGFALGLAIGAPLPESLALGCACSGAYVRDAQSPARARLVEFLSDLPSSAAAG